MRFGLILPAIVLATSAHATSDGNDRALMILWDAANLKCRGSADPRAEAMACRERDRLDRRLEARGYCLRRIGLDHVWIRCR